MRRCLPIAAVLLAVAAAPAAPAAASVDPGLEVPRSVHRGAVLDVRGLSWVVGAGCAPRVTVRLQRGDVRLRLGRPRVPSRTAAFRIRWTVPEDLERGRWRVVAVQDCDEDAYTYMRSARVTVR
jgi:hypothetical protein